MKQINHLLWIALLSAVAGTRGQMDIAPAAAAQERSAVARPVPQTVSANIIDLTFWPDRLEIALGTTVEWRNLDPVPHTVTARDGSFHSGVIQPGGVWRHTFSRPGTYSFFCQPHPQMTGVVVVN